VSRVGLRTTQNTENGLGGPGTILTVGAWGVGWPRVHGPRGWCNNRGAASMWGGPRPLRGWGHVDFGGPILCFPIMWGTSDPGPRRGNSLTRFLSIGGDGLGGAAGKVPSRRAQRPRAPSVNVAMLGPKPRLPKPWLFAAWMVRVGDYVFSALGGGWPPKAVYLDFSGLLFNFSKTSGLGAQFVPDPGPKPGTEFQWGRCNLTWIFHSAKGRGQRAVGCRSLKTSALHWHGWPDVSGRAR